MPPDLTNIPAPAGSESWWPYVMASASLLVAGASAIWAAIDRKLAAREERRLEAERSRQEDARLEADSKREIELERLRTDFERQKDFQQDLIDELRAERQHSKELSELNRVCRETVMARDNEIRERDRVIVELQRKIAELERKIEALTRHVATLEGQSRNGDGEL